MSEDAKPAARLSEEELAAIGGLIVEGSPHAVSLGMRMTEVGPGRCVLEADYDKSFVGDPETGVVHGGVATALLDHACGVAAALGMKQDGAPVTLDLRIDYFRAARPGRTLVAAARCVRVTHNVAFVSALAHDGDPDDPVASAASSFVIPGNAPGKKEAEKEAKSGAEKKGKGA
jgi:uncharacterized protein (TIGR00369 family)